MDKKYKTELLYSKDVLKRYSLVFGCIALTPGVNAEIIYTDIDPDTILNSSGEEFFLDLNNDSIPDYRISLITNGLATSWTGGTARIMPVGNNNKVAKNQDGLPIIVDGIKKIGVYGVQTNAIAGNYQGIWASNSQINLAKLANYYYSTYSMNQSSGGDFINVNDGYIGLRLQVEDKLYFGWVRLDIDAQCKSVIIKGYGYEKEPYKTVKAGPTVPAVQNVMVTDVNNNGDGSDISISFTKAVDETNIDEYWIYVVRSIYSKEFSVFDAGAGVNATKIAPTGNNIMMNLPDTAVDNLGIPIQEQLAYNIFVVSVSFSGNFIGNVSLPSPNIILLSEAPQVVNVIAEDISNYGDGRDLQISFNRIFDEQFINEYRIFVVKTDSAGSFDMIKTNNILNYHTVNKSGLDIVLRLNTNSKDVDGDYVTNNESYKIFVLTVADGVNYTKNSLSMPSEEVILLPYSSTGIANMETEKYVDFYPNPVINKLYIKLNILEIIPESFTITNLNGQVQLSGNFIPEDFKKSTCVVEMEKITSGFYFIELKFGDNYITEKIIVF